MSELLIVLVVFGVAGYSNKAIYDKLHLDEHNKSVKETPPTYFECIERKNTSYEGMSMSAKKVWKYMKNKMLTNSSSRQFIASLFWFSQKRATLNHR